MPRFRIIFLTLLCSVSFGLLPTVAQQEDTTHVVQYGESLFRIALRYGVTVMDLAEANEIANTSVVYAGQSLIIPGLTAVDSSDEVNNPLIATAPVLHTIQPGETLSQIASRYDVTVSQIMQANAIANPNTVYYGQTLQIWTPEIAETALTPDEEVVEVDVPESAVVDEDEVVADIEPTEETSVDAVDAETTDVDDEAAAESDVPKAKRDEAITHIVQAGEHLSAIARRYGVSWATIAEANNITNPNSIYPGMELLISGSNTPTEALGILQQGVRSIAQNIEAPGAHWGYGRELVVDIDTQMAYAYEDGELQYSALVSTGLPATPTVQGEFAVWHKTPSQTMSGPGYYLPNVTWVMYFYAGYGFHTAYWHDNFGQPMSHGCVNMRPEDAEWFYNFASLGTNVYVQI